MSFGNAGVPETGSALSCSASVAGVGAARCGGAGLKGGNGGVRSTSKQSNTTRSSPPSFHTAPPPLKKWRRLGSSTCGRAPVTFVYSSRAASARGGGERRENIVAQTVLKKSDASVMPVEHGSVLDNREELQDIDTRYMPSECVSRHIREETWQHQTSDKVTQWLQDACQSSVRDIDLPAGSSVCIESKSQEMMMSESAEAGQEDLENHTFRISHLKTERVADGSSVNNPSAGQRLSGMTFPIPVQVNVSSRRWTMTTICGVRYSIRCLKLIVCLPVVLLGLYLRVRPNSWEQYEPPPT